MGNCSIDIETKAYSTPRVAYKNWAENKLSQITEYIDLKLQHQTVPTIIVLETGHFMLPKEPENLEWAYQNMAFSNALCKNIIQKHKQKVKIIPTLLINNLEGDEDAAAQEIIVDMLKNQKYINHDSLKIISERNLKNRSFKALKNNPKLASSFIRIDGKAYLKDNDYQHDLAAGFVNESGDIIPRCGLILTSYLDLISKLAKERLHHNDNINVLFISFSQQFHEYKRVMLGVDIYTKTHDIVTIDPMIFHWSYRQDQCLFSFKRCSTKTWEDLAL